MTKGELKKCEGLMYEAIRKANYSKENYATYEKFLKEGKRVEAECKLRLADQEIGYAEGINQVLAALRFKHDDIKTLEDLL